MSKIMILLFFLCFELTFSEPMSKFVVKNFQSRLAMCNDGTPAIYYLRTVNNSKKWFVFLQGGGGCYDEGSCNERYKSSKFLMSSDSSVYTPTLNADGILSDDCEKNPAFCNHNEVLIEYCSSDWWSGNHTKSENWFVFLGKEIIKSVIEDLMEDHGMKDATDIVLSGGSAGGVGAWSNSDYVGNIVKGYIPKLQNYSVISDCGWFLGGIGMKNYTCTNNEFCNYEDRMTTGLPMWTFIPHEACGQYYKPKNLLWKCLVGYEIYTFVKARKFGVFYIFDKWQASQDFGVWKSSVASMTSEEQKWVSQRGEEMYESIVNDKMKENGGVLALGCFEHVMTVLPAYYQEKSLSGELVNQVILEWEQGGNPFVVDQCKSVVDCNPSCNTKD